MNSKDRREDLTRIFLTGVNRVDPYGLIKEHLHVNDRELTVNTGTVQETIHLERYQQIFVIGFGKATANMALAMEELLGDQVTEGVISVKYGHIAPLKKIRIIEAGHPVPDENGMVASRAIANLASRADATTLVLTLISGGGSALIPLPLSIPDIHGGIHLSLAEKQAVTRVLLACGATIHELNTVRKHLSEIKGGRLAEQIAPATSLSLVLSDVVGDNLDVIASGATAPDNSRFEDVKKVFERYQVMEQIPQTVREILSLGLAGKIPETPGEKHPAFNNTRSILLGTNAQALEACKTEAERRGYTTRIVTSQLVGEARDIAAELFEIAMEHIRHGTNRPPVCLLFGGETTVTIKGTGKGGRNQEMALAFLAQMEKEPEIADRIWFLSGGTDGNDGPTDAAGAFADATLLAHSGEGKHPISHFLDNNDSYHFFDAINGLLKTGPTNTNVCDIQVIVID